MLKIVYIDWPLRFKDFIPYDFFLYGYLKRKMYVSNHRTIDEVRPDIIVKPPEIFNDMIWWFNDKNKNK